MAPELRTSMRSSGVRCEQQRVPRIPGDDPNLRPQLQPTSFHHIGGHASAGAIRAAAVAARQARHARSKRQEQQAYEKPGWIDSTAPPEYTVRPATLVQNTVPAIGRAPFHKKKQLNLHLNLSEVTQNPAPFSVTTDAAIANSRPQQDAPCSDQDRGTLGNRPRRLSSITMSIRTPEGAAFHEVANDGPERLGQHTKKITRLGKGAGGVVYLSVYAPQLRLVAVKEVTIFKDADRQMVQHELHALHKNLIPLDVVNPVSEHERPQNDRTDAPCPFLVAFYGAYLVPAKRAVSIVMEFMDMGSLQDLLDIRVKVPEPILRHCAYCCMVALHHMHHQGMIHRDIKPANILMNRKGEFKVADFGLADTLSKSQSSFSRFQGTVMYMSPERIQGQAYSHVSDMWSMGITLFYLATGAHPFALDEGFFGLEEAIVSDPLPPMPNRFSRECREFVKALLRRDPGDRMTAVDALEHPFLRGYDGSNAWYSFPRIWQKTPLAERCTGKRREYVPKIAEIIVNYSRRNPDMLPLPALYPPERTRERQKSSIIQHFAAMFRSHGTSQAEENDSNSAKCEVLLRRLTTECCVSRLELQAELDRVIHSSQRHD